MDLLDQHQQNEYLCTNNNIYLYLFDVEEAASRFNVKKTKKLGRFFGNLNRWQVQKTWLCRTML